MRVNSFITGGKILPCTRLSGSPYCDDHGEREQTTIDFNGGNPTDIIMVLSQLLI